MEYIVIDNFNDVLNILSKDDGSGEPIIFGNAKEAQEYCDSEAQNGIVVPLINFMSIMRDASDLIGMERYAAGEDIDPNDIEGKLNEILGNYDKS